MPPDPAYALPRRYGLTDPRAKCPGPKEVNCMDTATSQPRSPWTVPCRPRAREHARRRLRQLAVAEVVEAEVSFSSTPLQALGSTLGPIAVTGLIGRAMSGGNGNVGRGSSGGSRMEHADEIGCASRTRYGEGALRFCGEPTRFERSGRSRRDSASQPRNAFRLELRWQLRARRCE